MISIIYLTTGSSQEARNIAKELVESGLVACANILSPAVSVYKWEGELKTAEEYPVILKTVTENVKRATKKIIELHSYDCPCVVSWPITEGSEPFIKWVRESTSGSAS